MKNAQRFASQSPSAWFYRQEPLTNPTARLFCFPYAGGGTAVFRGWQKQLPTSVEVLTLNLPGREMRFKEPPRVNLADLLDEITPSIIELIDRPFALFGHSMGGLLAFELARRLRASGAAEPALLFVSGCRGPHLPERKPPIHGLPEDEFLQRLRTMNGTPQELLQDEELMALLGPVLRADLQLIETWNHQTEDPLAMPIIATGGEQDDEAWPDELRTWSEHTSTEFQAHLFPGDHFFLNTQRSQLLELLSSQLRSMLGASAVPTR